MSTLNIRTAILPLTAPGASISPDSASLARKSNEFASNLTRTSPSRFGFFAALPDLFDTAAVLEEIAYSFDVLGADGVTLFTRYGEGHYYLGHAAFEPIWKELDRREAVVFIHPTHPVDTALFNPRIPQPVVDYPHETTRTAVDMIVTGTKRRYSKCKVILSHAGGTLPFLIGRVAVPMKAVHGVDEGSFMEDARSFFYDLALSSTPGVVRTLLELVGDTQILYGSDFPYAPRPGVVEFASQLDGMEMSEETRRRIGYENALGLFPRLARILREEIRESGSGAGENTATKVSETGTHEEL
jgi:predicted TIM-barrel fold metal-dependent hydrolase